jgi:hypothetical protein
MTVEKRPQVKPPAAAMTREQAMYLLKTIYPKAPVPELIKAAIICAQYHLNPLMRQIFLICFNEGKANETWAIVQSIKATRQIAGRDRKYTYKDGPRVMTEAEQVTILGQAEPQRIWAITVLQDSDGNQYPGYGFWPRGMTPYGQDKGNTDTNMAFIRSERNALDKMSPGALPDIEVAEETYAPVNVAKALAQGEKEVIQQGEIDIDELFGPEAK